MRKLRTGLIIAVAVLALFSIPLVVLCTAPMRYAGLIENAVRLTTGLKVHFDGLEVDLFPPRLTSTNLTIFNPNTAFEKPVVAIDRLSLTADPGRLIRDAPGWWSGDASGLVVRSGHDGAGRNLWNRPGHQAGGAHPAGYRGPLFRFGAIRITDMDYRQMSGTTSQSLHVARLSLVRKPHRRLQVTLKAAYRNEPVTASGTLALPSREHAQEVDFKASLFGASVRVAGTLGNEGKTTGHVKLAADAQDLNTLGQLLEVDLSTIAPLTLEAHLRAPQPGHWTVTARGKLAGRDLGLDTTATTEGQMLKVDKLTAQLGDSDLTASGKLSPAARKVRARLSSRHLDINQLSFIKQAAGPPSGHEAHLLSRARDDAAALNRWTIDARLQVDDLYYRHYAVQGLELDSRSNAGKLTFSTRMDTVTARNGNAVAWQLSQPLHIDGDLSSQNSGAAILSLDFHSRGFSGQLESTLPGKAEKPLAIRLETTIENFSSLPGLDTKDWDALLPLGVTLQARATGENLHVDPLTIRMHGNELDGQLRIDTSATPAGISGDLHAGTFDLNRIATTSAAAPGAGTSRAEEKTARVFSTRPVPVSWLDAATLDIGLRLDRFRFNQTRFRNVHTRVSLQDGRLFINPIAADLKEGGMRGYLQIAKAARGATLDTRLIVTRLVPADLGEPDTGLIDGGATDLFFNLEASGATPHALAASLDGELALEIQRATIRNEVFERLGSDLLTQTVNLINPFARQEEHTRLVCAAAHFNITDGVLTSSDQIIIKTKKMIIRGGGDIDLGKETLGVDLVPSPRSGLGVGVADFARVVRLGGTLSHPHSVADPAGIMKSGASVGAAIATSGVSLLAQGLFNRLRNAHTDCGKFFERTVNIPAPLKTRN